MNRADIIIKVQAQLDELSTITSDNPYTDLIDSVLDNAAVYVSKTAPKHLLNLHSMDVSSVIAYRVNYITFDLPDDFLRLSDLYHPDFERAITDVSLVSPPFWGKYTRPGKAKPQIIIHNGAFVFSPQPGSVGLTGQYIQEELPKDMNERSVPAIIYKAAMDVMTIVQDFNGAKAAGELLMDFYQNNIV